MGACCEVPAVNRRTTFVSHAQRQLTRAPPPFLALRAGAVSYTTTEYSTVQFAGDDHDTPDAQLVEARAYTRSLFSST